MHTTLQALGVDPAGILRMVEKGQGLNIVLQQVPCAAANIIKQEMLAIGADAAVARGTVACRLAATDVLLMGTLKQYRRLIGRLPQQPFGLSGLASELQEVIDRQLSAPAVLRGKNCCLDLARPQVMGIINVTPDSFYDGGVAIDVDAALRQAELQIEAGADLLDIGGESTRPGSVGVTAQVELQRVLPAVKALLQNFDVPLSIDTTKATVAAAALECGADFINDISGLTFDPEMAGVVAAQAAGLFVMHTRGRPAVMQQQTDYNDLMAEIVSSLRAAIERARHAGISADHLAIDPGIGFGKSVAGNLHILRHLSELRCLGAAVLLGTSRKSFIGKVLQLPDSQQRLYGSLATVALGVANGAQIFRVHDVAATRQVVDMAWAIAQS